MKKLKTIIVLLLVLAQNIALQSATLSGAALIDSLEAGLAGFEIDSNYVNILATLSFKHYAIDPNKGIEYGLKAVEVSQQISYKNGLAKAYNAIGVNYAAGKSDYINALKNYKDALKIYKEINNKSGIGASYNNIALVYQSDGKLNEAIEYFENSVELAKEIGNKKGHAGALNNIGNIYNNRGDFAGALEYFQESKNLYREIDDKEGISFCLINIGLIYSKMAEIDKALNNYEQALEIQEQIDDKRGIANSKNNIGTILTNRKSYKKAEKYLKDALNYFILVNNPESISNVFTNLGILKKVQLEFNESLHYFQKAYDLRKDIPNSVRKASSIANIGSSYYSSALDSSKPSSRLNSYNKEEQLTKAVELFEEAIQIFEEEGEIITRAEFSRDLSNAYELLDNQSKALKYFQDFHYLQDSIYSQEKTKELTALIRKQELKEKVLIERLEAEKKAEKIATRNRLQYLGIGAAVVAFGIILLLSGRMNLSEWKARALVFLSFIFLFEFVLVIIDPYTDEFSEGMPLIKFGINMCLALIIFPMHQYLEKRVSLKVLRPNEKSTEQLLDEFRKRNKAQKDDTI